MWSSQLTNCSRNLIPKQLWQFVPLIFVIEGDLFPSRDPPLGEEADSEFAVDGPLLRLGDGVAAVVDEAGDVAPVGRVDEVLGLNLAMSQWFQSQYFRPPLYSIRSCAVSIPQNKELVHCAMLQKEELWIKNWFDFDSYDNSFGPQFRNRFQKKIQNWSKNRNRNKERNRIRHSTSQKWHNRRLNSQRNFLKYIGQTDAPHDLLLTERAMK